MQLSLAFRNDNYTLDTRLKQAERERNLMEENTEKELEEFKSSLKVSLVGKCVSEVQNNPYHFDGCSRSTNWHQDTEAIPMSINS